MLAPGGNNHRAFFVEGEGGGAGREVVAFATKEVGGMAGHPDQCPSAKVCHGEALPWPSLREHVGIKVPPCTILVVTKEMYGGVVRVHPELEGVAQVVEWRQIQEYAAVTDFVRLRKMNLVLDDPKKGLAKACSHVTRCE